jgi:hypothetical protein
MALLLCVSFFLSRNKIEEEIRKLWLNDEWLKPSTNVAISVPMTFFILGRLEVQQRYSIQGIVG